MKNGVTTTRSAKTRPLVVVFIMSDVASRRRMIEGISAYLRDHTDWDVVLLSQRTTFQSMEAILSRADGVISALGEEDTSGVLQKLKCPVVLLGGDGRLFATIDVDDVAVGRLAVSHFRDLGLRSVAYCGITLARFSKDRCAGMAKAARQAQIAFHEYPGMVYAQMDNDPHELQPFHAWLQSLPKPVGMLCTTCDTAHVLLHHCRTLGIDVPEQIAVLGVDDDDLMCEITRPHLSTIDQAGSQMGYRAAELLHRALAGQPLEPGLTRIPPRRVIARESTDMVCTDSPMIAKALRYVRDHACDGISVSDIAIHVSASRRALERGFLRNVGRTVHDEITRLRLERARYLLITTDLKTLDIATRSGFSSAAMLCNVFKRECEISPGHFRADNRST